MKNTAQVLAIIFALVARLFGSDYSRTTISCGTSGAPLFRNAESMMLAIVENIIAGNNGDAIRIALHGKVDPSVSHVNPGHDDRVFIESLKENNARGQRPVTENEILNGTEMFDMEIRFAKNGGPALMREDAENRASVSERMEIHRRNYPM